MYFLEGLGNEIDKNIIYGILFAKTAPEILGTFATR
jgi:hypothetical protein